MPQPCPVCCILLFYVSLDLAYVTANTPHIKLLPIAADVNVCYPLSFVKPMVKKKYRLVCLYEERSVLYVKKTIVIMHSSMKGMGSRKITNHEVYQIGEMNLHGKLEGIC